MQLNNENQGLQRGVEVISWTERMCQPLRYGMHARDRPADYLVEQWEIEYSNRKTPFRRGQIRR